MVSELQRWLETGDQEWFQAGGYSGPREAYSRIDVTRGLLRAEVFACSGGLAFVERTLWGFRSQETRTEFWDRPPVLPQPSISETEEDSEYFRRYKNMARLDLYSLRDGEIVLIDGWPPSFRDEIDVLRKVLRTPRYFRGASGKGLVTCRFSLPKTSLIPGAELSISIEYDV